LPGDGYDASLIVPLKSSTGEVRGILQLHDPIDPERGTIGRFDASLQQMMESFSSLAVAALDAYRREQALRQEIRQLTIVIDENKRRQEVDQIVDSDFFQSLQSRGRSLRMRRAGGSAGGSADDPPAGGA
jgi:GAF domain-containing protein